MNSMWLVLSCLAFIVYGQELQDDAPLLSFLQSEGNQNGSIDNSNNITINTPGAVNFTIDPLSGNITDAVTNVTESSNITESATTNATESSTNATESSTNATESTTSGLVSSTVSALSSSSDASASNSSTISSISSNATNVTESINSTISTESPPSNSSSQSSISDQQSTTSASAASSSTQQQITTTVAPRPNLPALPLLPTNDTASLIFVAKGTYVKTSAPEKSCKQNQECYGLREPDEWCPLPEVARYGDKGCFCDHLRNFCVIQRVTEKGEEYSDCADKSTSGCSNLKPVVRIQQHNTKNKNRLRVHRV